MRPAGGTARTFGSLATAILKGFVRDKQSVFFAVVFPLMFLVLFGSVFKSDQSPRIELGVVGSVPVIEDMGGPAKTHFEKTFELSRFDGLEPALEEVRSGDLDAVVTMDGKRVALHYTQTDQVRAGIVQGTMKSYVDSANVAATGQAPAYGFQSERVEDESLTTIQFMTPGLLGWAVAMSAAFGAAATLQGWRTSKLLRRLQLSPAPTGTIVAARVVVTIAIALVQMAIFLGLATVAFGMQLSGTWWLAVPLLVAGTLSFMSLGLLAGALAKSTEGAVNLANFFVLPMAFLSGSFFPLDGAPAWLTAVSRALPLRHLNDAMLDVLVRGLGWSAILAPLGILLGFTLVVGLAAVRLFRWESD
jgi:ABC-2 type transport system permease protein